jgi:uncharacterized protein YqeY
MLKQHIQDDVKAAMRSKDKARLGTLRLITAAIKQREVDERIELDDTQVVEILDKMVKQRRDSISQYEQAGRSELAQQESAEIAVIQEYLPTALSEAEILDLIAQAIQTTGAAGMQDMGKIMGQLKPQMQGRADMAQVSKLVKQKLTG